MIELMSRTEMIERVGNGEDCLELSIEKWVRIEKEYLEGLPPHYDYGLDTCALCFTYHGECSECLFSTVHGHGCDHDRPNDRDSYYHDAVGDIGEKVDRGNVRKMIEALKKCREEEKPDTVDRLLKIHMKMVQLAQNCEGIGLSGMGIMLREMIEEIELVMEEVK